LVKVCRRWGDVPKVPREACAYGIMIVTNRGPSRSKRPKKAAQQAEITAPRIVQHRKARRGSRRSSCGWG
jgi:hypothetical protein